MRFLKALRIVRDEVAAISAFVLIMFVTMIVGGGMGIDFMYHESERASLQDALDRGVLAAASFEVANQQGINLESRVVSYLRSNSLLARRNPTLNVTIDVTQFSRRISVSGSYKIDTFFLKLIGINSLNVTGFSTAETSRGEVEISMILDNSGSMYGNKMRSLINASNNFVDLMLNAKTIPNTSISLVPFTAQVNPGALLASRYNLNQWHNYSWCFEFAANDYSTTGISRVDQFEQVQHYYRGNGGTHECPPATILPFSNDPAALHSAINGMAAGGYTATYAGMKWGAALLDPGSQSIVTEMIAENIVDPGFAGRPVAWDDQNGTKFIILMTDGANTAHRQIRPWYYNVWGQQTWQTQNNADYWNYRWCGSYYGCYTETVVSGRTGDTRLQAICDAAKTKIPGTQRDRIIVFTIGFEVAVNSNPYNMMRQCASSYSKFYHATAADLDSAFTQIASSITKLRLVD